MAQLHATSISKTRMITGYILSALPSAMLIFSATMKLFQTDMMVKNMEKAGLPDSMIAIGLIELLCVALYWIPITSNIGFFLICSYAGGIIATEWSMGAPIAGVALAVLIYVGTFLRKPELSGFDL